MKRFGLLLCVALGLCSCSLSEHLARVSGRVERDYAATQEWDKLPVRTISWNQALAMMNRNNLELQSAQSHIEKAERNCLRVYTDLIPMVSYYSTFNKSIDELTRSWSKDDYHSEINVNFNVPTLTQLPYRVYSSKAQAYAAVKAREGKERELTSKLYQAVRLHEIELRRRALEQQNPDQPADELANAGKDKEYWKAVGSLLGDYSARWNILPESMPHLRWADYEPRLDRLDPLLVCKFALQLEQARMLQYGIAMQYLPTINLGLYSPSLFSSTGGHYTGTFLSSKDTRLNMNVAYNLDTRLMQWNQYMDSKAEYKRTQQEVAAALMEHKDKILMLRRSYGEYQNWNSYMTKRLDYLRTTPPATAAEFIEQNKAIQSMQQEMLSQEEKAVESEAALVLEYGMPKGS